jgi:hypothetical protein
VVLPLDEFLLAEPQGDLPFSTLHRVTTVADVASSLDAIVTSDGAWNAVERVGGAQHDATSFDGLESFPDHGDDRTGIHVLDETGVEGLGGQVFVVFLQLLLVGVHHFQGDQLESALLEALDNVAHQASLHTIGLDGDEGSLSGRHFHGDEEKEIEIETRIFAGG